MMQQDLSRLHADTVFAVLERKRMLDSAWVVSWVSLLATVAVPWFLSVLAIDLGRAAAFVFGSALAYLIVYADSYQIVEASDSFFQRMLIRPSEILGRGLFDIVQFDRPDEVRETLAAQSGEMTFSVYRVRDEIRIANNHFYRTEHRGVGYIYIGWQELTDLYYLQSAFDAVDDPLVIIADSRLHFANRTARELLGALHFGMYVETAPALRAALEERPADAEADEGPEHQEIDGRPYQVHRLAARLPGGAGNSTIVWLHCVVKEKALFEQAVRDPLTGIYNRRYFYDALARHVEKNRGGRELACAYFDLDCFKQINDQWGHAAGDAAITSFVDIARSQLRAVDVFARLGGDEFAVLFVNCDLQVAAAAIDRIRATLNTSGWTFEGETRPLSFSAGLAACRPEDDVPRLLQRTDKALYTAKAAGKGRSAIEE